MSEYCIGELDYCNCDCECTTTYVFLESVDSFINIFQEGMPYKKEQKLDGTCYNFSQLYVENLVISLSTGYLTNMSNEEKSLTIDFKNWINDGLPQDSVNELYMALDLAVKNVRDGEINELCSPDSTIELEDVLETT